MDKKRRMQAAVQSNIIKHHQFEWLQYQLDIIRACQRCRNLIAHDEEVDDDGFDEYGFDRDGYDRDGFDVNNRDRQGNIRPLPSDGMEDPYTRYYVKTQSRLQRCSNSPDHRDDDGYDAFGYDPDGYDEYGFDREGLHRNGIDRIFKSPEQYELYKSVHGDPYVWEPPGVPKDSSIDLTEFYKLARELDKKNGVANEPPPKKIEPPKDDFWANFRKGNKKTDYSKPTWWSILFWILFIIGLFWH